MPRQRRPYRTLRSTRRLPSRRGTIYILTLGTAMIVGLLAMAALFVVRIQRRQVGDTADSMKAALHARAAVDMALYWIEQDPGWRDTSDSGTWNANWPAVDGTYRFEMVDPVDGNLTDSNTDSVVVTGIGTSGSARQKLSVMLLAEQEPLEVLSMALHSDGVLNINPGITLRVVDAPASTNGHFFNGGVLDGSVEALTESGAGVVTGTTTIPASTKDMPDPSVFDLYVSMAQDLSYNGDIDQAVIAPGYNSYDGQLAPAGIYYLNVGGNDLTITRSRVHGTLVIEASGRSVTIGNEVFLHTYQSNYPVLIIRASSVNIQHTSGTSDLSEADLATNFNPPGAEYQGTSNTDQTDVYPNEIQGLVHVIGSVVFDNSPRVRGVVIAEGTATVNSATEIIHDPLLYQNPPEGYRMPLVMVVSPGSWQKVVD